MLPDATSRKFYICPHVMNHGYNAKILFRIIIRSYVYIVYKIQINFMFRNQSPPKDVIKPKESSRNFLKFFEFMEDASCLVIFSEGEVSLQLECIEDRVMKNTHTDFIQLTPN